MSTFDERGKTGDQGERGYTGHMGERGPTGDHGQTGETGSKGDIGLTGATGTPHLPLAVRRATLAYFILVAALVLAIFRSEHNNDLALAELRAQGKDAIARIDTLAIENCEAINDQSQGRLQELLDTRKQIEEEDLGALLGISPDRVDNFRTKYLESNTNKIKKIPFVDCITGKRLPSIEPPPQQGN